MVNGMEDPIFDCVPYGTKIGVKSPNLIGSVSGSPRALAIGVVRVPEIFDGKPERLRELHTHVMR